MSQDILIDYYQGKSSKEAIFYQTLARNSCEFFNENFMGAVSAEYGELEPYKAYIAFDSYALFMRRLFDFIFGRSLLRVSFQSASEKLEIIIGWKGVTLGQEELTELKVIATKAGFDFDFENKNGQNLLIIKIDRYYDQVCPIYATNDNIVKHLLVFAFKDWYKPIVSDGKQN